MASTDPYKQIVSVKPVPREPGVMFRDLKAWLLELSVSLEKAEEIVRYSHYDVSLECGHTVKFITPNPTGRVLCPECLKKK